MKSVIRTAVTVSSLFFLCLTVSAAEIGALKGSLQLIETPNEQGHVEFVQGLDLSRKSVDMQMYHLTETRVIDGLVRAATRGVQVRILLDGASFRDPKAQPMITQLQKAGVQITGSSPAFSLTHSKAMIVDGKSAFITSINLTKIPWKVRDFGIITEDKAVIAEMTLVFQTDWSNAQTGRGDTPPLTNSNLLWSPVNSKEKLTALIDSAQESLVAMVENVTDLEIAQALSRAQARGVRVRFLVPMCNMSDNSLLNYPVVDTLTLSHVEVRVMPAPASPELPYIHAKMIVADGKNLYVGSENFSFNSLTRARELGVMLTQAQIGQRLVQTFESDWAISVPPPSPLPSKENCSALGPKF